MLRVELEDLGQDFLVLFVDERTNVIQDATPFQGWLWRGRKVLQKKIYRGLHLKLSKPGEPPLQLRYAVESVTRESGGEADRG
ncbi:MAG TPA: hypothetical protein VN861_02845 [Candidatus Acidoferrales bacterium]|nr:hypothetical protein [Candidatus Acidoferrales bacterium]